MANNLTPGPNVAIAKADISFGELGATTSNTGRIYKVDGTVSSYSPSSTLNAITGFENGKGYFLSMLQAVDWSAYLTTPGVSTGGGGGTTIDADAQAAITATGATAILTPTDTLFKGLKAGSGSLWTKKKALYPIYGTTSATAKWNFFNPLDTDEAHRAAQVGAGTFNGGFKNGTDDHGGLWLHLTPQDFTAGFTAIVTVKDDVGTTAGVVLGMYSPNGQGNATALILAGEGDGGYTIMAGDFSKTHNAGVTPPATGIWAITGGASLKDYYNGTKQVETAQTYVKDPGQFVLGNGYPTGVNQPSNRKIGTVAFFDELTDAEVAAVTTLIQNFETAIRA